MQFFARRLQFENASFLAPYGHLRYNKGNRPSCILGGGKHRQSVNQRSRATALGKEPCRFFCGRCAWLCIGRTWKNATAVASEGFSSITRSLDGRSPLPRGAQRAPLGKTGFDARSPAPYNSQTGCKLRFYFSLPCRSILSLLVAVKKLSMKAGRFISSRMHAAGISHFSAARARAKVRSCGTFLRETSLPATA